jgi:hypothetical protein
LSNDNVNDSVLTANQREELVRLMIQTMEDYGLRFALSNDWLMIIFFCFDFNYENVKRKTISNMFLLLCFFWNFYKLFGVVVDNSTSAAALRDETGLNTAANQAEAFCQHVLAGQFEKVRHSVVRTMFERK